MKRSIVLIVFETALMLYNWGSVIKDLVKFQFPSCGRHFVALGSVVGASSALANGKSFITTGTSLLALTTSALSTVIFLHRDFGRPLPAAELVSHLPLRYSIDDTILIAAAALACAAALSAKSDEGKGNGK